MNDLSIRKRRRGRRLLAASGLVVAVAAVALTLVPAAFNSGTPNGLTAYVTVTNRGPIPKCPDLTGATCPQLNQTQAFIHVINSNKIEQVQGTFKSRATLVNSFVVSSVKSATFVNGQPYTTYDYTFTPPPDTSFTSWAGHWPSTVTCETPGVTPCTLIGSPAIISGENTTILYTAWLHGGDEPNGKYVFKYTIHGTLNGSEVVLTATSPTISMTP